MTPKTLSLKGSHADKVLHRKTFMMKEVRMHCEAEKAYE